MEEEIKYYNSQKELYEATRLQNELIALESPAVAAYKSMVKRKQTNVLKYVPKKQNKLLLLEEVV